MCVNYLLLTGRQLVPCSGVRLRHPLFLVFNAVLNPPSVVVLHTQIIPVPAVLESKRESCKGTKKPSFARKKTPPHCVVIHLEIHVSDERDEKH